MQNEVENKQMTNTPQHELIIIGKYCLEWRGCQLWLTIANDGEGMEVPMSQIENLLETYYKENF